MKKKTRPFLYRVEVTDKKGNKKKHLAEVLDVYDENARRKIVHKTLLDGGRVHTIMPTTDKTRYPGEAAKKFYKGN